MGREIVFRGKRLDYGTWVYGDLLRGQSGKAYIGEGVNYLTLYEQVHIGPCRWFEVDPATVGQYTNLRDKNGVEIYEGDIVNATTFIEKANGMGAVYWSSEGLCWMCRTRLPFLLHKATEIEVIGNIYDNPELLKEAHHGR